MGATDLLLPMTENFETENKSINLSTPICSKLLPLSPMLWGILKHDWWILRNIYGITGYYGFKWDTLLKGVPSGLVPFWMCIDFDLMFQNKFGQT